jgi:hypothetical protein
MKNETHKLPVEWVIEQLQVLELNKDRMTAYVYESRKSYIIHQAKEMEKEQSVKFALHYAFGEQEVSEDLKINIEKLYNETYGGNK